MRLCVCVRASAACKTAAQQCPVTRTVCVSFPVVKPREGSFEPFCDFVPAATHATP